LKGIYPLAFGSIIAADFKLVWLTIWSFPVFPGVGPFSRSIEKDFLEVHVLLAFCVIMSAY
jgi:hypothetical protein